MVIFIKKKLLELCCGIMFVFFPLSLQTSAAVHRQVVIVIFTPSHLSYSLPELFLNIFVQYFSPFVIVCMWSLVCD